MVKDIFFFYFKNLLQSKGIKDSNFKIDEINILFLKSPNLKSFLKENLENLRILDPCCGSGRFLLGVAKFLFNLYKKLDMNSNNYDIKRKIIAQNIYGIEREKQACLVSKLNLYLWLISGKENSIFSNLESSLFQENLDIDVFLEQVKAKFNIINREFLLEYKTEKNFDIIIGNPPYIENKKIKDREYKKKLYSSFETAYKLFDLSILFIEKALSISRKKSGFISFIITNKFLSADFGLKIRSLLIHDYNIMKIINVSSLPIFKNRSSYPIIITLKNQKPDGSHEIEIKKYESIKKIINDNSAYKEYISQDTLLSLPKHVIPIRKDIKLLQQIFKYYKTMKQAFKDLKIIYRPYGFTNYAKHFDSVIKRPKNEENLGLLIGTGNVGKFHIKFNKRIKIAKRNLEISYFNFPSEPQRKREINAEKLIFREIARELTCVYDPGIFTNITGLYFIRIPSLSSEQLFSLMMILNSNFIDSIFKTLYETLHMSGGYLRFNGSFIETLPMPHKLPKFLAQLGWTLQFLNQFQYDYNHNETFNDVKAQRKIKEVKNTIVFLTKLSESLVKLVYLLGINSQYKNDFHELYQLISSEDLFPLVEYKYTFPYFKFSKFKLFFKDEINSNLNKIELIVDGLKKNKTLFHEIETISSKL
jgi:hypothetical protein